ncbi:hypothetical protein ACKI1Q_27790 [Streptomyces galilaeus]|uniref:hypothetical protein n=1 Tax=Streptomyces galilaeus TaxID=33899 RepID=UPI0038F6B1CC
MSRPSNRPTRARANAQAKYDNAIAQGEDPEKAKAEYDKAVAAADPAAVTVPRHPARRRHRRG